MERLPLTRGLAQAPVRDSVFIDVSKILEEKYLLVSDFITNSKFVPVFLDLAFGNSYYSVRRLYIMFELYRQH